MNKTTRLYVLRAAKSTARGPDGKERTTGAGLNIPLTAKGEKDAAEFAKTLSSKLLKEGQYFVLSSDAKRARDTATPMFNALKSSFKILYGESINFRELSQSQWEGQLKEQTEYAAQTKVWDALSAEKKYTTPLASGCESYSAVANRMLAGLSACVKENPGRTIFVVTHNHNMTALALQLSWEAQKLPKEGGTKLPELAPHAPPQCGMLQIEIPVGSSIDHANIVQYILSKFATDTKQSFSSLK